MRIVESGNGHVCGCATKHVPAPLTLTVLDRPDGNVVVLCPASKINLDHLLRVYVATGGVPAGSITKHYGKLVRTLAKEYFEAARTEKDERTR